MTSKKYKIFFKVIPPGSKKEVTESLWAEKVSVNQYRLTNIPCFAYDVSNGDVVSTETREGMLFFEKVVLRSGHSTYRIIVVNSTPRNKLDQYLSPIFNLGCVGESMVRGYHVVCIDVPPTVDIIKVYKLLELGENNKIWTFEEAHYGRSDQ